MKDDEKLTAKHYYTLFGRGRTGHTLSMAIEISNIDHVNVESDDIERSARFYREVIGLREGPRPKFDRPGYWMYADDKPVVHIIRTHPNNDMLTGSKDASISHFALRNKP